MSAQTTGPHRHAFAAPAVTGDHDGFAGDRQIGRSHDAIPYGLAGTVTIIEQMFAIGVVHRNHGEFQPSLGSQGPQTQHAGGGFFRSAHHVGGQVGAFAMQQGNQIAAIVDDDLRFGIQGLMQKLIIFRRRGIVPGEYPDSGFCQRRRHIILRG